jgi:hypothetical protein
MKGCAAANNRFCKEITAVIVNNAPAQSQPDPRTRVGIFSMQPLKYFKNLIGMFSIKSNSIILN